MEYDLATGQIRNLTSHFPNYGFTRAVYLANGHILLTGPVEYHLTKPAQARANCWMFILDPSSGKPPQPLNMKAAEGPVPSRKRMHLAWSQRAAAFPTKWRPVRRGCTRPTSSMTVGFPSWRTRRSSCRAAIFLSAPRSSRRISARPPRPS